MATVPKDILKGYLATLKEMTGKSGYDIAVDAMMRSLRSTGTLTRSDMSLIAVRMNFPMD